MFEPFTPGHGTGKRTKPRSVRLFVEELEGRCLLSSGFGPLGGITTGQDGYIWFLEKDRLGRIDPNTGLIQEFAQGINTGLPWYGLNDSDTAGHSIAEAPDGSLWFLSNVRVTRFTPSTNALSTFNLSAGSSPLDSITIGQDGVVWVLEQQGQSFGIARIDPATGGVENFAIGRIPGSDGSILGIAFGPDGKIWITSWFSPIEEMDPATGLVGNSNTNYSSSAIPPKFDPNGTYWDLVPSAVPAAGDTAIREYNPSTGRYQLFPPTTDYRMLQLTPGPDGNIWYTYIGGSNGIRSYYLGQFNPATGATETFSSATPGQVSTGNPPLATGKSVSALASINFLTAVASFTPQVPIASPGQAYQATIQWGDGTSSSLVLTVTQNGTYDVVAPHAYQSAGTYNIKVTIGNFDPANPLGDNPITVFSTANVDPFNMNM